MDDFEFQYTNKLLKWACGLIDLFNFIPTKNWVKAVFRSSNNMALKLPELFVNSVVEQNFRVLQYFLHIFCKRFPKYYKTVLHHKFLRDLLQDC